MSVARSLRLVLACASASALGWTPTAGRAAEPPEVTVVFAGDIMLDEAPGEAIARGEDPFAPFADILARADLAVGNLECSVATTGAPVDKPFAFRAHPQTLAVLARHFGAVSLANNHSGDYGRAALRETMAHLREAKLPYFGAGLDLGEAHAPIIVERKGVRIALLGYDDFLPRAFEAAAHAPGVAWAEDEQMVLDIRLARARGADVVIPFVHWGWEGEPQPCDRQRELARRLIDAGADAVVGGHPHVTQGFELYRGKLILYSLGNFVFNGFHSAATRTGWVLRLAVAKTGISRWDIVVAKLGEDGTPVPDSTAPAPASLETAPKP